MTEAVEREQTEVLTYREAIRGALREEMARDESVFLMGEDVGAYGGIFQVTRGLQDEFGAERVRDTPLSEAGIVGLGVGAAATGSRPVVEVMFSDFIGLSTEQITNQAAKMRYMFGGKIDMPLTIRTTEGAGFQSASQHSGTVHSWFAHAPGVKVAIPGTPRAAKGLLKTCIRSNDPVLFFENKMLYDVEGDVPTDDFTVPLGHAVVERVGDDVTVVATQRLLKEAKELADDVADSVSLEIVDPQSLYPLDVETIKSSVAKTGRLVIADESPISYGVHAEIAARMVEDHAFFSLDAPIQRVGVPDTPVPFNPELEREIMRDRQDIRNAVDRIV